MLSVVLYLLKYSCPQGDIQPHILKYRAIIEELMYKAATTDFSWDRSAEQYKKIYTELKQ